MRSFASKCGIAAFWLAVWQAAAVLIGNDVLLVGPVETVSALRSLCMQADFRSAVCFTLLRIAGGFLAGVVLGFGLGALSFFVPPAGKLLSPFVTAVKTVPVACYAIMLLIWFGKDNIAFFVCMLVVFPILYVNTLQGFREADRELMEIAAVFTMTKGDYWRHIWFPSLSPFLYGAFQVAVGMSWKSGIAAEVIGMRIGTLGNELNRARTLLETDRLFALTLTVILLSWGMEKLILFLMKRLQA